MKLDKRKCRKYADPGLNIQPDSGILHAGQIAYIVRTATKIIDHHRTLILYIYPREQAAQGDSRPRWTMFHCKDDFLTLARNEDGSTSWRTAAFSTLDGSWDFAGKCAFILSGMKTVSAAISDAVRATDSPRLPVPRQPYRNAAGRSGRLAGKSAS